MEKQIKKTGLQDRLRSLCGEIAPGKRLALILAVLAVGTAANLYITFRAVYQIGRNTAPVPGMERHITGPGPLKPTGAAAACDSLAGKGGPP